MSKLSKLSSLLRPSLINQGYTGPFSHHRYNRGQSKFVLEQAFELKNK